MKYHSPSQYQDNSPGKINTFDLQKKTDDILLSQYTPPCVLVNDQFDIVQFRGDTAGYLKQAIGQQRLNVIKMAREGLGFEISNGLSQAKVSSTPFIIKDIPINNGKKWVTIEVIPLPGMIDMHFLILFKEQAENKVLHNIFMRVPAMLYTLTGPDHVFELVNPLYRKFIGTRELVGEKFRDAFPELHDKALLEILDRVYSSGEDYTGNEILLIAEKRHGKMQHLFLNTNYQAIKNADGKTERILAYSYDVTDLVMARKKLEQNAEMIRTLYMNAPAFICTMRGPQHVYDLVNPSYQKIFGKRVILGKPIMEALPELKGQGFDNILDNVYKTGQIFIGNEVPITLARDEGLQPEQCYFNFSYQPIYDEDKNINGILVFGYEVTEIVRNKKLKQESDARFRMLADALPEKMSTMDEHGDLNYLNQQWLDYTHKSFEDIKTSGWKSIIHPADWESNQRSWKYSVRTGEKFELEQRFLSFDGTYIWHLSRRIAQKDDTGKILGWIGTHTDINEQKMNEQIKDDFISIASHEMKTPLTIAKAYLQLLEFSLDKNDLEANLYANKASNSVTRLNNLINELLDVSKIQSGKLNYNITTFNFNKMIDNCVEDIQYSAPRHVIIKTGKIQQLITGDKDRLQQVVINLLNNAIKYTPNGGKIFLLVGQENGEIKVSIKDKGIGIARENLEKIFLKYYRVTGHASKSQGLGIGLFICHEIIQRHNGKLWAESTPGKGSKFCFTLPLASIQYLPFAQEQYKTPISAKQN